MDIRFKNYPYPVLSKMSDDYVNSSFVTDVEGKIVGYELNLRLVASIVNDELKELINDGKAKYVFHLECPQTGFREVVMTQSTETNYIISEKRVSGLLQICPFIVATEPIMNYVNKDFHEDFRGIKFDIDAGCIMAVGTQTNLEVEKDISDLSNPPSVFSIIKSEDETESCMLVDMSQRKLIIKLPEKDYYNYKSMKDNALIKPVLNSLVIIPALIHTLQEIARRDVEERFEYSSTSWYKAIKKVLKKRFECDIESNSFNDENMIRLAQRLIDSPVTDALQTLSMIYTDTEEEDEET